MPEIPYDRGDGQRQYLSIPKHLKNAKNKFSKWINVQTERQVFDNADRGSLNQVPGLAWLDANDNLWGFLANLPQIGVDGEQFGFFDNPQNPALRWHGFPVIPFSTSRYSINNELLYRWVQEGVFNEDDIPALLGKKRIK